MITKHKLCVTGSKGKTSVIKLIGAYLVFLNQNTIQVDSTGSFIGNTQTSTFDDSMRVYGTSPNVKPGRYIRWSLTQIPLTIKDIYILLECSFACYKSGIGTGTHDIGILTNIYKAHINDNSIRSEKDLLERKSFVLSALKNQGTLITSIDNPYTKEFLHSELIKTKKPTVIGISSKIHDYESLHEMKKKYQLKYVYYLKDNDIFCNQDKLANMSSSPYFLSGNNRMFIENTLFFIAYSNAIGLFDSNKVQQFLESFRFSETDGRFNVYQKGSSYVIIDYAHEQKSVHLLINLLYDTYKIKPYLITRFSPPNNKESPTYEEYIDSFSELPVEHICIYDKVDGVTQKQRIRNSQYWGPGETVKYVKQFFSKNHLSIAESDSGLNALKQAVNENHPLITYIHNNDTGTISAFLREKKYKKIL